MSLKSFFLSMVVVFCLAVVTGCATHGGITTVTPADVPVVSPEPTNHPPQQPLDEESTDVGPTVDPVEAASRTISEYVTQVRAGEDPGIAIHNDAVSAADRNELIKQLKKQVTAELSGRCDDHDCPFGQPTGPGVGPTFRWLAEQLGEFGVKTNTPIRSSYSRYYMEAHGWPIRVYHKKIRSLVYADCVQFKNPRNGHWYCGSERRGSDWWHTCQCSSPPTADQPLWPEGDDVMGDIFDRVTETW